MRSLVQRWFMALGMPAVALFLLFIPLGPLYAQTRKPSLTSINPMPLREGGLATITGTGFGTDQNTGSVNYAGAGLRESWLVTSWSDKRILVMVPRVPSGSLCVVVSGVSSNCLSIEVTAASEGATLTPEEAGTSLESMLGPAYDIPSLGVPEALLPASSNSPASAPAIDTIIATAPAPVSTGFTPVEPQNPGMNLSCAPSPDSPTFACTVSLPGDATGAVTITDRGMQQGATEESDGGQRRLTVSLWSGGMHLIQAEYAGNERYQPSQAIQVINLPKPENNFSAGCTKRESLIACSVSGPDDATGFVSFKSAVTLNGGSAMAGGAANLSTSSAAISDDTIELDYGGDPKYPGETFAATVTSTPSEDPCEFNCTNFCPFGSGLYCN